MNKENTGLLIKDARIKKGLTQLELSDILGVSNKAVSRWECGETFPDVGLLDTLANTLDLTIEELVLGELLEKCPEAEPQKEFTCQELVRAVKFQGRQRIRTYKSSFFCGLLALFILIESLLTFLGHMPQPSVPVYAGSLVLVLWITGLLTLSSEKRIPTKAERILSGISVGTFCYSFLLLLIPSLILMQGEVPDFLPVKHTGPFLMWQLVIVFTYNFVACILFFIKSIREASCPVFGLYLCEATLFLTLFYQSILSELQSVKTAFILLLGSTGLVLIILATSVLVIRLCKKKLHKSFQ